MANRLLVGLMILVFTAMTACLPTPTETPVTPPPAATVTSQSSPTGTPRPPAAPSVGATTELLPTQTAIPVPPADTPTELPPTVIPPTPCTPPVGWPIYSVRPGDTLNAIASNVGLTSLQLKAANCIATDVIFVGQPLAVPFIPPPPTALIPTPTPATIPPTLEPLPPPPAATPTIIPPTATSESLPTSQPPPPATSPTSTIEPIPAPPPGDQRLLISPPIGPVGTTHLIALDNFQVGEVVTVNLIFFSSGQVLHTLTAGIDGHWHGTASFTSRPADPTGQYVVRATGNTSARVAYGSLEITP